MVIILVAGLFALPGVAHATEFVGSDLGGSGLGADCNIPDGCVVVQETIGASFADPSANGVITQWLTRGASGPIALRTYRHSAEDPFAPGELHATPVDQSQVETGAGGTASQTFFTRIPVQAEDYIALALADGSDYGHRQGPPAGTNAFVFDDSDPPSDVDRPSGSGTTREIYLRVRVEPDADGDGLGDETQDPCVGCGGPALPAGPARSSVPAADPYASIRAKGPRISLAGKATASRTGAVPIVLTNPYGFPLKGKVSLKDGKAKTGSKRFSLGARAKKTVKVKLPRKIFRRLKRKRRLRLTALAKGKAAVGKSRTTRKKVRVTAPPRKRRKKRRPKPPTGGPVDGTFRGTTEQGRAITITTIDKRRQIRVFVSTALTNSCLRNGSSTDPENVSILPPVPFPVGMDGSFTLDARNESEDGNPNYRIRGRFSGDRVSGSFAYRRLKTSGFNNTLCVTKELTFSATR